MKSILQYLNDLLKDLKYIENSEDTIDIVQIKQKSFALETAIEILKNLQERNR